MRWAVIWIAAVVLVWLLELLGVNRHNVLYLNGAVEGFALPLLGSCAALFTWFRYRRLSRAADTGGRAYLWRRTDFRVWVTVGISTSLLFGALAAIFVWHLLRVLVHFYSSEPLQVSGEIVAISSSAPRSVSNCAENAQVMLPDRRTSTICIVFRHGGVSLWRSKQLPVREEKVLLRGRFSWLGAVVDEVIPKD